MKKTLAIIIVLLIIACAYMLFYWQPDSATHKTVFATSAALPEGGEFTLQSQSGSVSLQDYRGKVVLIYFGYTMCPDICPTNLSLMSNAFAQMDKQQLEKVQGIFISVDPKRDTMKRLAEYTQYFHESIKGISGQADVIREIANRYGAAYQIVIQKESATNYVVDHSSETYVINPQGKLVARLPHAAPPQEILEAIRKHLPN